MAPDETFWPFEPAFDPVPAAADPAPLPPRNTMVAQANTLAARLSQHVGRPVRLFVTDNRSTMVSFRRHPSKLVIRVHHMFLGAPEKVVKAIAEYSSRGAKGAGDVIDLFVRANSERIRAGDARKVAAQLDPRGRVYDLKAIFERLNLAYFDNAIQAGIGWGRGTVGARRRRTIRMGVYDHLTRTIRVHPALDRREVPEFFVEYIVFHEMLHQAIPGKQTGRRKQHHGPEFRAREKAYPGYERALAWERQHLGLLLGKRG